MEKSKNEEHEMKLPRWDNDNNKATNELFVSDLTTPSGQCFYHYNVLRSGRYVMY